MIKSYWSHMLSPILFFHLFSQIKWTSGFLFPLRPSIFTCSSCAHSRKTENHSCHMLVTRCYVVPRGIHAQTLRSSVSSWPECCFWKWKKGRVVGTGCEYTATSMCSWQKENILSPSPSFLRLCLYVSQHKRLGPF